MREEYKKNTWKTIYIMLGAFIVSLSVNSLLVPHKLLSGGVTGIAILLHYFLALPTGVVVLAINVPIFALGIKYISKRFAFFSLVGTISFVFFLTLTKNISLPVNDQILAAVSGGVLNGIGMGIIFRSRGSLGGTDILAVICNRFSSVSIGSILMAANAIILLISAFYFNVQLALYTMISMYISTRVVDFVQDGLNYRKSIVIISDKPSEITEAILENLHRGVTFLHGEGAYTHQKKEIIYCIIKTMELAKLKEIVIKIDPKAFMSVSDAKEVLGKGFYIEDFK